MIRDSQRAAEADAQEALRQYTDELMEHPDVTGVGIQMHERPDGTHEPVVSVYVSGNRHGDARQRLATLPDHLVIAVHDPVLRRARHVHIAVRVYETGDFVFE